MFRDITVGNKLCFKKQLNRSYQLHVQHLRQMRSTLDCSAPRKFKFICHNPKKLQSMRDTLSKINSQNKRLADKMKQTKKTALNTKLPARVNKYKQFLQRQIQEENKRLIVRLIQKKSHYQLEELAHCRFRAQRYINNISSFPYKGFSPNKTFVRLDNTPFLPKDLSQLSHKADIKSAIYTTTRTINQQNYKIECFSEQDNLKIVLSSGEQLQFYLNIPVKEANGIIQQHFEGKLHLMINDIVIDPNNQDCYIKCVQNV